MPDPVTSMILEGLREVKESVARLSLDMGAQLSRLPDYYMPRRENEHRLDEHTIDIGELRSQIGQKWARHEEDMQRVTKLIEDNEERREQERKADEERRETYRRWAIGIAVPAILALAGLIVAVLSLMARTA